MRVFFYGKLAGPIGPQLDVSIEAPCSVAGLRRHLVASYPAIAEALQNHRVKALVGDAFVADDYPLGAGDEVEFLAPVSGG